ISKSNPDTKSPAAENSDILNKALRAIKEWAINWKVRYFLTDDSAVEQLAVQKAFPGLIAGEQEVSHLLCKVHSMRTLDRRLKAARESRRHLLIAMVHKTTEIGCDHEIELAIRAAPSDEIKNYIIREWRTTKSMWAMFSRQHSPLLLQV
ncbi:hypothetical protein V1505DRAFT_379825, partial [Lipomyces doorenjongii]